MQHTIFKKMIAPEKQKTLLVVGRTNFHKSSLVLEALIAALHSFGITIISYESQYTSISKAIHHELGIWDQSRLSHLLKDRHRSRHLIRKAVKIFLRLKHPSRWRYFFSPSPKSTPGQAQDLRKFIRQLNKKNIIILSHSAGSIIASLVTDEPALKKIISFGYPFKNPDNHEEPYRTDHLKFITKPLFIIQGRQDAYGGENVKTRYTLSSCISMMFTNDNHDYNSMSPEDYEVVLQRVRSFIEDPN